MLETSDETLNPVAEKPKREPGPPPLPINADEDDSDRIADVEEVDAAAAARDRGQVPVHVDVLRRARSGQPVEQHRSGRITDRDDRQPARAVGDQDPVAGEGHVPGVLQL